MKKSLIALAALSAFGTAAQAQSSVTVYGLIDAGYATSNIDHFGNVETNQKVVGGLHSGNGTGTLSGSRLGFRGTEDLGGGLKANFVLETGINYSNGQAATTSPSSSDAALSNTSMFANVRQGWAGLSGGFGEVRIGTHNSLAKDMTEAIDPNAGVTLTGWLAQTGLQVTRPANSITYLSPVKGGFSFQAQYDEGESTTSNSIKKDNYAQAFSAMYKAGNLTVAASTESRKNAYYAADGNRIVNLVSGSVVAPFQATATTIDKVTHNAIGATYTISGVTAGLLTTSLKYKDATATDTGEIKTNMLAGSGNVGVFTIRASLSTGEIKDNGVKTYDMDAYQLVAMYPLSKRSHLYGAIGQTKYDSPTADADVKINQMGVGMRTTF